MNSYVYPGVIKTHITVESIEKAASQVFESDPFVNRRHEGHVSVRHIVYFFGRHYLNLPYSLLGYRYRQNHATVIHGCKKVMNWYRSSNEFRENVNRIASIAGIDTNEVRKKVAI